MNQISRAPFTKNTPEWLLLALALNDYVQDFFENMNFKRKLAIIQIAANNIRKIFTVFYIDLFTDFTHHLLENRQIMSMMKPTLLNSYSTFYKKVLNYKRFSQKFLKLEAVTFSITNLPQMFVEYTSSPFSGNLPKLLLNTLQHALSHYHTQFRGQILL